MTVCECHPGTFENGWMETRCESCLEVEMRAWDGLVDLAASISRKLTEAAS